MINKFQTDEGSEEPPILMTWDRAATILHLIFARYPVAIARRVVAVVVPAIQRQLRRWARTLVFVEGKEVFSPSLANFDSPSAVIFPVFVVRIRAALNHLEPYPIFGRSRKAMFDTSLVTVLQIFRTQATTALRVLSSQLNRMDGYHITAIAKAVAGCHIEIATRCKEAFKHLKTAKAFPIKVNWWPARIRPTRSTTFGCFDQKTLSTNPSFCSASADTLTKCLILPFIKPQFGSQNFPSTEASAGSNINWLGHWYRMFESARETLTRLAGNFLSIT